MSLDLTRLEAELQCLTIPHKLFYFSKIDSTNTFLKEQPSQYPLEICCAEEQVHGRGQSNNSWYSPPGVNIYCSTKWRLKISLQALSGLSLAISLAILNAIHTFHKINDIKLKWPNDVLWNHKKLAGTLIEIIHEGSGDISLIIGIGLNVNLDKTLYYDFDNAWCSLFEITKVPWDRVALLGELIQQLHEIIQLFIQYGFKFFHSTWSQWEYLKNREITLTTPLKIIEGTVLGVDDKGLLILKELHGITSAHHFGKISLLRDL